MSDFFARLLSSNAGSEPPGVVQPRLRLRFEEAAPLSFPDAESTPSAPSPTPVPGHLPASTDVWPTEPSLQAANNAPQFQPVPLLEVTPLERAERSRPAQDEDRIERRVEPLHAPRETSEVPPQSPAQHEADPGRPPAVLPVVRMERVTTRLERVEQLADAPPPPALAPVEPPPRAEPPPPVVRVAIGRMEVHAPPPPPAPRPPAPSTRSRSAQPVRSLDAYLKGRNEDRR